MTHRITAITAILLVLTCPLACGAGAVCSSSQPVDAPTGCCCAGHCEKEPASHDEEPSQNERCRDWCFCTAAVCADIVVVDRPLTEQAAPVVTISAVDVSLSGQFYRRSEAKSLLGGDNLRIVLRSLLC